MKIKQLKTEKDQYGRTIWPAEYPETFYSWEGLGHSVWFEYRKDCEQSLEIAKTLAEAQAIVDKHHNERVQELLAALLEPETPTT